MSPVMCLLILGFAFGAATCCHFAWIKALFAIKKALAFQEFVREKALQEWDVHFVFILDQLFSCEPNKNTKHVIVKSIAAGSSRNLFHVQLCIPIFL